MNASVAVIVLAPIFLIGLFGPVIAGIYLAAKLNGRR
jgi:hypothetical protein